MFDVSWGQLAFLGVAGVALVGKKDLPRVAEQAGTYVGRFVGMIVGARHRMDKFTSNNELQKLQRDLRSGLRELDIVKSELALASSSSGLGGRRGLGGSSTGLHNAVQSSQPQQLGGAAAKKTLISGNENANTASFGSFSSPVSTPPSVSQAQSNARLAPRKHSVAAIAEDEWVKQGIGFKSRAEMGTFGSWNAAGVSENGGVQRGGANILNDVISDLLIFDQYDRVLQEQNEALRVTADKVQKERKARREDDSTT